MTKTATRCYTAEYLHTMTKLVRKQFIKGRWVWVWANGLITECKRGCTLHHKSTMTITVTRHIGTNVGVTKPVAANKPVYHVRREPTDKCHRLPTMEGKVYAKISQSWGMVYYWYIDLIRYETYTTHGSSVHRTLPLNWEENTRYVNLSTGDVTWK